MVRQVRDPLDASLPQPKNIPIDRSTDSEDEDILVLRAHQHQSRHGPNRNMILSSPVSSERHSFQRTPSADEQHLEEKDSIRIMVNSVFRNKLAIITSSSPIIPHSIKSPTHSILSVNSHSADSSAPIIMSSPTVKLNTTADETIMVDLIDLSSSTPESPLIAVSSPIVDLTKSPTLDSPVIDLTHSSSSSPPSDPEPTADRKLVQVERQMLWQDHTDEDDLWDQPHVVFDEAKSTPLRISTSRDANKHVVKPRRLIVESDSESDTHSDERDHEHGENLPLKPNTTTTPIPSTLPVPASTSQHDLIQKRQFLKHRQELALSLFREFNLCIFGNQLPHDTDITWSNRFTSCAGRAHYSHNRTTQTINSKIMLSSKLLTTEQKLRKTLAHEMCHLGVWHLNGTNHPPHGKLFKQYGTKFEQEYNEEKVGKAHCIQVDTYHSYEADYKYKYVCTGFRMGTGQLSGHSAEPDGMGCGVEYGRYSKSLELDKSRCGRCGAWLKLVCGRSGRVLVDLTLTSGTGPGLDGVDESLCARVEALKLGSGVGLGLKKDGTPRKQNPFQVYVKENFARVRLALMTELGQGAKVQHKDVMVKLGQEWKCVKDNHQNVSNAKPSCAAESV